MATWATGAQGVWVQGVWATSAIGHMANGLMGHGPMGNGAHGRFEHFAHNIINTGWILTKILLNIDIDVFYLNTGRFLHDGLN